MNQNENTSRLKLKGLTKTYGSIKALDDVSLDLKRGEVLALLGENGAGKSTLVKMLAGLVQPDGGTIEIDGEVVTMPTSEEAQSHGVAIVTQEFSLIPTMSVAENLAIGQVNTGRIWGRRRLARRCREQLEAVDLQDMDPHIAVERLSVAERQLLEIARVVARDAKIVIFDEPTAALSDHEIDRVQEIVKRLAASGHSVIYVTHRLGEVFRVSDRVQVLRNGRALPMVATKDVDVGNVIEMMLGRELEEMYPERPGMEPGAPELAIEELSASGLSEPVSVRVRAGEILGLTGQVGSGASAVVRALAGTIDRATGEVTLPGGERLSLRNRRAGMRHGVAYCSADRKTDGIFAELPVRDNLSAPWLRQVSTAGIVSKGAETAKAREAAEDFALDPARLPSLTNTLSGGNQQKVALGKWLGIEPRVLLADEPTRGIDVGARAEIYRRLRDLASRGMFVVIASSDTNEVMGLCDTVATFYRGAMTEVKPIGEWTEPELLEQVMHREEAAIGAKGGEA